MRSGADIDLSQVFAQSFNLADVVQWIQEFPTFGLQAVSLISENPADPLADPPSDGDILPTIDVLAQDVGIIGLFSDGPATTTFYANCLK